VNEFDYWPTYRNMHSVPPNTFISTSVLFPFHSTVDTSSAAIFRFLEEYHHFMVPLGEKANQHSLCDTAKKKGR
jgi:hypothetical protein